MAHLDHIWAGWRSEFVTGAASGAHGGAGLPAAELAGTPGAAAQASSGCVFCDILASGLPDEELNIVWRHPSAEVVVILNAYPYTSGHLMAMPSRHVGELEQLSPGEASAMWEAMTLGVKALKAAYDPGGINIGANLGRAAGAGVPGHFHMHMLPRWMGDTNFMTAVADARVLPEALSESRRKLLGAWPQL
ncbi:MAG TPA: HIT domain-containing protein [Acidimicrobiales bacterium]|nr:HIT domain-containing protein [Acidimicrobiales bacterium]